MKEETRYLEMKQLEGIERDEDENDNWKSGRENEDGKW